MKKLSLVLFIMVSLVIGLVGISTAADKILETEIQSISVQPDKNGNDYSRIVISEIRELNGIKYTTDVLCMGFGSVVENARKYSAGDTFKAVVSENEYRGRLNYNIIAFIE